MLSKGLNKPVNVKKAIDLIIFLVLHSMWQKLIGSDLHLSLQLQWCHSTTSNQQYSYLVLSPTRVRSVRKIDRVQSAFYKGNERQFCFAPVCSDTTPAYFNQCTIFFAQNSLNKKYSATVHVVLSVRKMSLLWTWKWWNVHEMAMLYDKMAGDSQL